MTEPVLRVKNLNMSIKNRRRVLPILSDLNFEIREGEHWGIAGESGAGKSMTACVLTSLLPDKSTLLEGEVLYRTDGNYVNLLKVDYQKRQPFCADNVSIVMQDAINALNPYEKIDFQWRDTLRLHSPGMTRGDEEKHMLKQMEIFGVPGGKDTLQKYPHQLSGGMKQRIAIAMALESSARILIADEPTTSLDAISQRKCVDFIRDICNDNHLTLLYISHNLGILQYLCDHIMVMKDGKIVEQGTSEEVLKHPHEEYTKTLIDETIRIMGTTTGDKTDGK